MDLWCILYLGLCHITFLRAWKCAMAWPKYRFKACNALRIRSVTLSRVWTFRSGLKMLSSSLTFDTNITNYIVIVGSGKCEKACDSKQCTFCIKLRYRARLSQMTDQFRLSSSLSLPFKYHASSCSASMSKARFLSRI